MQSEAYHVLSTPMMVHPTVYLTEVTANDFKTPRLSAAEILRVSKLFQRWAAKDDPCGAGQRG